MSNRKPGDYVVNSELTQEQIERFVADCVEAGAKEVAWNHSSFSVKWYTGCELVGAENPGFTQKNGNDCTHEYKTQPNHLDLPTVLEECAEHLRAGRDPFRQIEVHDGGGWRQSLNYMELAACAVNGNIRRKPQTITINGVEVPRPESQRPNDRYWCLSDALNGDWDARDKWVGAELDHDRLKNGQVYLNKSDRDQAAQAIIKALRGEQ